MKWISRERLKIDGIACIRIDLISCLKLLVCGRFPLAYLTTVQPITNNPRLVLKFMMLYTTGPNLPLMKSTIELLLKKVIPIFIYQNKLL